MSENKQPKPISNSLKRFFGVGDFGFTFMSNIDTFYSSYFFTNIAKLPLGVITVMTTISAVVDAILSAMYGAWMNKIKPQKWGRYRSWLLLTPWMVPILFAFQFITVADGWVGVAVMLIAMITSRIAWNLPFIANLSMINVAGKTPDDRMALSASRTMYTSLANVTYSYVGPAAVALLANFFGEQNSYAAAAFAFGALMAAGYYAHFKMFEGYEETGEEELARLKASAGAAAAPKVSAIKAITVNPHLISLLCSSLAKYMVLFLVNGLAVYYFEYVGLNPGLMSVFMLITNLLGVAAGYSSRHVVAKMGAKRTVTLAYCVMCAMMVTAFFLYKNVTLVIALMTVTVFAMTLTNACEPELYAACAGFSSKKLGVDTTGTVMGLLTVPLKIGIVIRGILIPAVLALGGFDASILPADASDSVRQGICLGFMIIPAACVALGAVILNLGYKLDKPQA